MYLIPRTPFRTQPHTCQNHQDNGYARQRLHRRTACCRDSHTGRRPAAARNVRVAFDTPASLTGKVLFTAPVLSGGGTPLSGKLLAQISVNGTVTATLGDITPGAEVSTEALSFPEGVSTVKVVMATTEVRGATAETEIYAGEDIPEAVSDVFLEMTPEGWAKLTWQAPSTGANGGNLDQSTLRYTIRRAYDGAVVALNIADRIFTDKNVDQKPPRHQLPW